MADNKSADPIFDALLKDAKPSNFTPADIDLLTVASKARNVSIGESTMGALSEGASAGVNTLTSNVKDLFASIEKAKQYVLAKVGDHAGLKASAKAAQGLSESTARDAESASRLSAKATEHLNAAFGNPSEQYKLDKVINEMSKLHGTGINGGDPMTLPMPSTPAQVDQLAQLANKAGIGIK